MELTPHEQRVIGTLIEKGFTTPMQYPLTMNSLVTGCNQKSCREPLTNIDEERVFLALDGLRRKGLVTLVQMAGSHTDRWKHRCGETLQLEDRDVAILGELLLRGAQTDGELRARASRMVSFNESERVTECLEKLQARTPPLVVRVSPPDRRRGVRFFHTLAGEKEITAWKAVEAGRAEEPAEAGGAGSAPGGAAPGPASALRTEVDELRARVAAVEERLKKLEQALGGPA